MRKVSQFNWRKNWKTLVVPHLRRPLVKEALALGMEQLNPDWKPGEPPYALGADPMLETVKPDSLEWYQPAGRCHWISFFAAAIGILNYPELDWRFVTGVRHTVPVGFDKKGEPVVVMDILLSDHFNAQQSMSFAALPPDNPSEMTFNKLNFVSEFQYTIAPRLYFVAKAVKRRMRRTAGSSTAVVKLPRRRRLAKAA